LYSQDPSTLTELSELLVRRPSSDYELLTRFSTRISFGTAGLRAKMGCGTALINSLVVIQTSQGLAEYADKHLAQAQAQQGELEVERSIVVGHDHRHNSNKYAQLVKGVFERRGWKVYLFKGLVHTPIVPFTAKKLKSALGVMITASHNPAQDNGYKVYWTNHVQIIPPHDSGIASCINKNLEVHPGAFDLVPATEDQNDNENEAWMNEMKSAYFKQLSELSLPLPLSLPNSKNNKVLFTYTPMHGVGLPFAQRAFVDSFGFDADLFSVVQEQASPDPDFPSVRFPNPEERGALDLAMRHADHVGSNIVLANDPDADRFCAAEKVNGQWRQFTGDQLGTLLGHWVLQRYRGSGKPIDKLAMCASTVSSKMLAAMARHEGFVFRETLTGFKYLGNEALVLGTEGLECAFAYEEAIGFMVGDVVRDKDGVSALGTFCQLASTLYSSNETLSSHLESLYEKYGYFETSNSYFVCRDPEKVERIFGLLRYGGSTNNPTTSIPLALKLPTHLAGFQLTSIRDLTVGYASSNPPSYRPSLPVDPKTQMISFGLGGRGTGDGVEVTGTVRTSGTEPKIKFYLEASGSNRAKVSEKLARVREALGDAWLRWEEFELEKA
ncbi:phosphoglucomutase 1, partial [Meredithblackwellia eburnea MCA 4105]